MSSKEEKKQTVHLYTICWNEEFMLKYFFKYYDQVVDKYVFFDDGSTDATLELLKQHPNVEVRNFPRLEQDSYILAAQQVHNTAWKECRGIADWVIITAVDEFLYMPDLKSYLEECTEKGVTAIPALGFQMVSDEMPETEDPLHDQVRRGCTWRYMNKLSIFDPNKIRETKYAVGRHEAEPEGKVVYPKKDQLLNLHYKNVGFEASFERQQELDEKLRKVDKENNWGHQYSWAKEKFKSYWEKLKDDALEDVLSSNYDPHTQHSELSERWWRVRSTGFSGKIKSVLGRFSKR